MKSPKLSIGLLLDSYSVPAWVYRAIELVVRSDFAEINLIILNSNARYVTLSASQEGFIGEGSAVYRLLNSIDERLFIRGAKATETKTCERLVDEIPVLHVDPDWNGDIAAFPQESLDLKSYAQLDIIVNFGSHPPNKNLVTKTKYGIWEYRFGRGEWNNERATGYWEVVEDHTLTSAELYARGMISQGEYILYRSQIATYRFSPARNRNGIYWFASSFLIRQMRLMSRVGEERFIQVTAKYNIGPGFPGGRSPKFPSNWEMLKGGLITLGRTIKEQYFRLFFHDYWYLLFNFCDHPTFDINQFRRLTPPKGTFWADPCIIDKDGKYYIFVEEYSYAQRKGHLSVFEMESSGTCVDPVTILEKKYHLSYPFVFEQAGKYYMVPESGANKSIDLYDCEEFPYKWKYRISLMEGLRAVDTTMFYYEGKWWLFTGIRENEGAYPDVELFLFYSDTLFTKDWKSHPLNPVVSDVTNSRPAGGVYLKDGKLYRPAQNCSKIYGNSFNINEILCLSETDYKEKKITTIRPDWDRNAQATHTYNHAGKLNIVDAFSRKFFL